MDISYLMTQAVSLNRHIKQQNANDNNWQDSEHKSVISALVDTLVAFYELFHILSVQEFSDITRYSVGPTL